MNGRHKSQQLFFAAAATQSPLSPQTPSLASDQGIAPRAPPATARAIAVATSCCGESAAPAAATARGRAADSDCMARVPDMSDCGVVPRSASTQGDDSAEVPVAAAAAEPVPHAAWSPTDPLMQQHASTPQQQQQQQGKGVGDAKGLEVSGRARWRWWVCVLVCFTASVLQPSS